MEACCPFLGSQDHSETFRVLWVSPSTPGAAPVILSFLCGRVWQLPVHISLQFTWKDTNHELLTHDGLGLPHRSNQHVTTKVMFLIGWCDTNTRQSSGCAALEKLYNSAELNSALCCASHSNRATGPFKLFLHWLNINTGFTYFALNHVGC